MPAAALLAGALALVGCGGGSGNPTGDSEGKCAADETGTYPDCVKKDPMGDTEKSLDLPNKLTLNGLTTRGEPNSYTIEPGEPLDLTTTQIFTNSSVPSQRVYRSVRFTCPSGGEACVITIPHDGNTNKVHYTGGKPMVVEISDPAIDVQMGATDRPTAETDPLSDAEVLKALKTVTGSSRPAADKSVWNTGSGNGNIAVDASEIDGEAMRELQDGSILSVRVDRAGSADSNQAYFGDWYTYTPSTTGDKDTPLNRGVVWGGATKYGKKPEAELGTATYGKSDGTDTNVLLYYSEGGTGASDWKEGTGSLFLTANFKSGKISGGVGGTTLDAIAGNNDIAFRETDIGSDGTFMGQARFSHKGTTRQEGSWAGGFFGKSAMDVTGDDDITRPEPKSPEYVAGEFEVSRPGGDSGGRTELHVRGAFGNDMDP